MASTTGIESWALDLAEVGPIYPFQGTEAILVVIGFGAWIVWHVVQITSEKRANAAKAREHGDPESLARTIDRHGD